MQTIVEKHIDALTPERLAKLVNVPGVPALSLYMPAGRSGDESRQNPIRYKNVCKRAAEALAAAQTPGEVTERLMARLDALGADVPRYWEHQSDGLAVFVTTDFFAALRLPLSFAEDVRAGASFDVLPLLPALRLNTRFALLNLNLNGVCLYAGSALTWERLELADVPPTIRDYRGTLDRERQLRMHSVGGNGGTSAVFHGHGAADDQAHKHDTREFFRLLDAAVCKAITTEHLPLVLAGTPANRGLYREVSRYPHLLGAGIEIDPEADDAQSLQLRALPIARAIAESETQAALARMHVSARRVTGIEAVLPAAHTGRVDTLFVPEDVRIPGHFDVQTQVVANDDAADVDLLNQAVIDTLVHGGKLYSVAASASPAALLRY
ncbi:MAG: hypothetical protein KC547_11615 [Anaerolineae bacterium]|nr:hypothetical protein [Anaerolineae bacterium]